ncbi:MULTISPECIES: hypothetical protein [Hyphomicrobiales]|uniref:hypothetical protein n=1 Tax=Hyphomicrobiales TaxID=356 RepID=UPI000F6635FB|nr:MULTISPECIES: hypothetical protein [Hyphomicrobiales]MCQ9147369.1 hypothetical protein [Ochrobactrum sp. BTU2]MDH1270313.1 hypothetical protein [Agrobacterium pusense]MDX4076757.1 hypothetical protein [Brucella sp. NBRC 113783]RSC24742.1 hypothetical protein EGT36_28345 [Agrobacterium sp. FDAARGOS_525]
MAAEQDSEPIVVTISPGYLGETLHDYVMGLPPLLRGTEIARLAFAGYKREHANAQRRKKPSFVAGSAVIEMVGRKIKWVG